MADAAQGWPISLWPSPVLVRHPDRMDAANYDTLPKLVGDLARWCLLTIGGAAPRPNAGRSV
jgi:hypothetical protein